MAEEKHMIDETMASSSYFYVMLRQALISGTVRADHSSLVSHLALGVSPLWGHAGVGTGWETAVALIEVLQCPQCPICVS